MIEKKDEVRSSKESMMKSRIKIKKEMQAKNEFLALIEELSERDSEMADQS